MTTAPTGADAPPCPRDPEAAILALEASLAALDAVLPPRDEALLERRAAELHRALAAAVQTSARAARCGALAPALRQRLSRASGRIAAQREALGQATAALDRAIEVLMPDAGLGAGAVMPPTVRPSGTD